MKYNWTKNHFDDMMFNPYWVERTNKKWIWERDGFPTAAFPKHYDFKGSKENREEAMRYMLFMYDKSSPLRKMIPDLTERKKEAASLCGIDMTDSTKPDYKRAKSLFTFGNEYWRMFAFGILKYQNSREWAMLVSTEQTIWENELIIYTEVYKKDEGDAKDRVELQKRKSALLKENRMLDEICREYEAIIFGDNEDVKKEASFNRAAVTPEEIARSMFKESA